MIGSCLEDYVGKVHGEDIVEYLHTIRLPAFDKAVELQSNPLDAIQSGLPVTQWDSRARAFCKRILKADMGLQFLFITGAEDGTVTAIRLGQIVCFYEGEDAMEICTRTMISSPTLTMKSALVLSMKAAPEGKLPTTDFFVFSTAPQMNLRSCIEYAIDVSVAIDPFSDDPLASHHLFGHGGSTSKPKLVRLVQFRMSRSCKLVLSHRTQLITLEITIKRPREAATTIVEHISATTNPSEASEVLATMLERHKLKFSQFDVARLDLAFQEVALVREWAVSLVSSRGSDTGFGVGLQHYLEDDHTIDYLLVDDDAHRSTIAGLTTGMSAQGRGKFQDGQASDAQCTTKACKKALKGLLDIELQYTAMVDRIVEEGNSSILKHRPHYFRLNGTIVDAGGSTQVTPIGTPRRNVVTPSATPAKRRSVVHGADAPHEHAAGLARPDMAEPQSHQSAPIANGEDRYAEEGGKNEVLAAAEDQPTPPSTVRSDALQTGRSTMRSNCGARVCG